MKALLKCSSYKSKSDSILNPINKFEQKFCYLHAGFQKSIFFNFTVGCCCCCCCAPRFAHFNLGNGVKCDCVTCNDNPSPGTPTSTLNLQPHFKALPSLTFESIIRHHHTHSSFVSLPVDCIPGIVLTVKLVPQLRVKTQKPRSNIIILISA